MKLQKVTTSSFSVRLCLFVAQSMPLKLGYYLSEVFANWVSENPKSALARTIRANQWVAHDENISTPDLKQLTRSVLTHAGRCYIDLYRNVINEECVKSSVLDTPDARRVIQDRQEPKNGCLIVTAHISNFDLALTALAYRGLNTQVLTINRPTGGYKIHNKIREKSGLEITPISQTALKKAFRRLKQKGTVLTAIERPTDSPGPHRMKFFGRSTALLPTGHIRLALATKSSIVVGITEMNPDGKYLIRFSEPFFMKSYPSPTDEIEKNGETILRVIEDNIRRLYDQWLMFYPLWPETLELVDNIR